MCVEGGSVNDTVSLCMLLLFKMRLEIFENRYSIFVHNP